MQPAIPTNKINHSLKCDANDTILKKNAEKCYLYNGFAFNVTRTILGTCDRICRIELCYHWRI